jgi:hypothetical protein
MSHGYRNGEPIEPGHWLSDAAVAARPTTITDGTVESASGGTASGVLFCSSRILQVDQLLGTIWFLLIELINDNDNGVGTMVRSCPDRLVQ